jgi:hypothetical protein
MEENTARMRQRIGAQDTNNGTLLRGKLQTTLRARTMG